MIETIQCTLGEFVHANQKSPIGRQIPPTMLYNISLSAILERCISDMCPHLGYCNCPHPMVYANALIAGVAGEKRVQK